MTMTTCTVTPAGPAHGHCGAPATHTATLGCVHEHMDALPVCQQHLDEGRRLTTQRALWCGVCRDTDGHYCIVHLAAVAPLDQP